MNYVVNALEGLLNMGREIWSVIVRNPVLIRSYGMNSVVKPTDKRRLLKIKLKSLAAEAKIIRLEEESLRRTQKQHLNELREEMANHRRGIVRYESRHAGLAYAFIRGKGYREVEPRGDHTKVDAVKVHVMVCKYGSQKMPVEFLKTWLDAPMRDKPPRKPRVPYQRPVVVDAVQASA